MSHTPPLRSIAEIAGNSPNQVLIQAGTVQCPFQNRPCHKTSPKLTGPYPICSVWQARSQEVPVAVCPKRLLQADILHDVIQEAWPWEPPKDPRVAAEVKMEGLGFVDFVIADASAGHGQIRHFISVELQALDITGSVAEEFLAWKSDSTPSTKVSYGLNLANVRKRYVTQLIQKGFFHHHWESRIVAVVQDVLFDYLQRTMKFDEVSPTSPNANVIFLVYGMEQTQQGNYVLRLRKSVATTHNSLMTASLYRKPPDRKEFLDRVAKQWVTGA